MDSVIIHYYLISLIIILIVCYFSNFVFHVIKFCFLIFDDRFSIKYRIHCSVNNILGFEHDINWNIHFLKSINNYFVSCRMENYFINYEIILWFLHQFYICKLFNFHWIVVVYYCITINIMRFNYKFYVRRSSNYTG